MSTTLFDSDSSPSTSPESPPEIIISIDYEVYDFLGCNRVDVFEQMLLPTEQLMQTCERHGAVLTIMFEMGSYFLFLRDAPDLASAIETQLCDAIARGHDVQLHLHPHLFPESGATYDPHRKQLRFPRYQPIHELLIRDRGVFSRCKRICEELFCRLDPGYEMIAFRAGKYHVQPHQSTYEALANSGFLACSNVVTGKHLDGKYGLPACDYRGVWTETQPYYPSSNHIWWPADVSEAGILEFPICTRGGTVWSLDSLDGLALINLFDRHRTSGSPLVMIGHSKGAVQPKIHALESCLAYAVVQCGAKVSRVADVARRWRKYYLDSDETAWQQCMREYCWPQKLSSFSVKAAQKPFFDTLNREVHNIVERQGHCCIGVVDCGAGEALLAPFAYTWKDDSRVRILATDSEPSLLPILTDLCHRAKFSNVTVSEFSASSCDIVVVADLASDPQNGESLLHQSATSLKPGGQLLVGIWTMGLITRIVNLLKATRVFLSSRSQLLSLVLSPLVRALKRKQSFSADSIRPGERLDSARRTDALCTEMGQGSSIRKRLSLLGFDLVRSSYSFPRSFFSRRFWLGKDRRFFLARRRTDALSENNP